LCGAIALLLMLFGNSMQGQTHQIPPPCGNDESSLYANVPNLLQQRQAQDLQIKNWIAANPNFANNVSITIPIRVVYAYNGSLDDTEKAKIKNKIRLQIDKLNVDFVGMNSALYPVSTVPNTINSANVSTITSINTSTGIQFCLATKDPHGLPTEGIEFVSTTTTNFYLQSSPNTLGNIPNELLGSNGIWDNTRYLNFYIIPKLYVINAPNAVEIAGLAYPDGNAADGAVVVAAPYYGHDQSTLTHEAGHWMGLGHIWGILFDCSDDDGLADTPLQDKPSSERIRLGQPLVSCGNNHMHMNFMDYSGHTYLFSREQIVRMAASFTAPMGRNVGFTTANNTNCIAPPILSGDKIACGTNNANFTLTYPYNYSPSDFTPSFFDGNTSIPSTSVTLTNVANTPSGINQQTFSLPISHTTVIRVSLTHNVSGIVTDAYNRIYHQPIGNSTTTVNVNTVAYQNPNNPNEYLWTYDHPATVSSNIKIPNGKTLIVSDTAYIPTNCAIIVEPGGILRMSEKAMLSSACNTQWEGVRVLSKINLKGEFAMLNDALIEHAKAGVSCGTNPALERLLYIKQPIYTGGGLIDVNGGKFLNNKIGIALYIAPQPLPAMMDDPLIPPLNEPLHANIVDAHFTFDDNYRTQSTEPVGIKIDRDKNIEIRTCEFMNLRSDNITNPHGYGILSRMGNFICRKGCLFQDLNYGINANSGYLPEREKVIILENQTNQCRYGIYAAGFVTFSTQASTGSITPFGLKIINNTLFGANPTIDPNKVYGAYLDGCTNFVIENNLVTNTPQGIIIRNSKGHNNIVYRNRFEKFGSNTHIDHCVIAMGENRSHSTPLSPAGTNGLQIKCNDFSGEVTDIWVDDVTEPMSNAGVRNSQGDPVPPNTPGNQATKMPAGNLFSNAFIPQNEIFSTANNFKYIYHDQFPAGIGYIIPTNVTNASPTPTDATYGAGSCPDNYDQYAPIIAPNTPTEDMASLWQQRIAAQTQKHILSQTLHNLKDGGNTPLTKNEVAMTQIQNAYQLYATLMAKSPYLSEEVLAELAEKENFPKTLIRDIMVANKHAGKISEVMTKLESRNDELPEYMLLQIKNAAASGMSGKELLEANITLQEEAYYKAVNTQVTLLRNGESANLSDYETVLGSAEGTTNQALLTELYLQYGSNTNATNAIQNFQNNAALAGETSEVINDYTTLYTTLLSIKNRNGNLDSLSNNELAALTTLAGSTNQAQTKARILLESASDSRTYTEPIPVWITPSALRKAKKTEKIHNNVPFTTVFPNPATDYINFEFVNTIQEKATLRIYSTEGKLIHTYPITENKNSYLLPTNTWANGLYFYQINTDDGLIEKGKFEVMK
jgi:parallel beta-helix repeat protein